MKSPNSAHSRLTRLLCLLLALHFLNFSIDSRDATPDAIPEDLTINDIESVSEFISEIVLNFSNAFAEYDECDGTGGGSLDINKVYYSTNVSLGSSRPSLPSISTLQFLFKNAESVLSLTREVSSPPPRA